jgi:hypothetical protein
VAIRPRIKTSAAALAVETDESAIAAIINRGGAPAGVDAAPVPVPAAVPAPVAAVAPGPDPVPVAVPVAVAAPVVVVAAPAAVADDANAEKKFTLRLPASLLAAIEKDAKGRPDRISVNTWLIGAALQRLDRAGPA